MLSTVALIVAGITAVVLTGWAGPAEPRPAATPEPTPAEPSPAGDTPLVMIIRHGEKPDDDNPGVDADGNEDDSSMTEVGWDRAVRLVDLFDPAGRPPRAGLARPTTIYAAGANDNGEGQRTRETVQPLAERLGIPVDTSFGKGDEEQLVEHVLSQPGPALIAWQHSEIPAIAEAFPAVAPDPPADWPDDRFDVIWTLTRTADGWRFAQLPELVLPQDRAEVIED